VCVCVCVCVCVVCVCVCVCVCLCVCVFVCVFVCALSRDVKQPQCGVDHSPASKAEVKESVDQYLYSSSVPSWSLIG